MRSFDVSLDEKTFLQLEILTVENYVLTLKNMLDSKE